MVQGWVKDLSTESGSRQEERGLHGHLKKASALTQRTERMGEEDSVDGQHIADVSRAGLRVDGPKAAAPSQGDVTDCDSGTGAATVLRLQDFVTCQRVFFPDPWTHTALCWHLPNDPQRGSLGPHAALWGGRGQKGQREEKKGHLQAAQLQAQRPQSPRAPAQRRRLLSLTLKD